MEALVQDLPKGDGHVYEAMHAGPISIQFAAKQHKTAGHKLYPGFNPGSEVLKQGTVLKPGQLALPCDILKERDVAVKLRDGVTIYVDVLRPANQVAKCPAIITYTPFGKNGGMLRMAIANSPWSRGIPRRSVSGMEVFEGPDPAYWCNHG
jgi:uncharacterized protein